VRSKVLSVKLLINNQTPNLLIRKTVPYSGITYCFEIFHTRVCVNIQIYTLLDVSTTRYHFIRILTLFLFLAGRFIVLTNDTGIEKEQAT